MGSEEITAFPYIQFNILFKRSFHVIKPPPKQSPVFGGLAGTRDRWHFGGRRERGGRRSDDESEHVHQPQHGLADVHVELCRVDVTPEHRGGCVAAVAAAGRPPTVVVAAADAAPAAVFFAPPRSDLPAPVRVLVAGTCAAVVLLLCRIWRERPERHLYVHRPSRVNGHTAYH